MKRFVSEIENMRLCTKGQHMVPIEDFHRNNSRPEGLCDWCKICTRNRRREMTGSTPQARFNAPPGTRRCSWCKEYRSLQLFGDTDNQRSGRVYVCDDCRPEYNRDVWYRTQYGLSLIEVESLFHDQKRRCAACGDKLDKYHLDHCHITNQIRGILCHHCNVALGHLRDDPIRIRALLAYLEKGDSN